MSSHEVSKGKAFILANEAGFGDFGISLVYLECGFLKRMGSGRQFERKPIGVCGF